MAGKIPLGWLAISFLIASAMANSTVQADSLQDYAQQCDLAIGPTVPDFDCDDPLATDVPGNNITGSRDGLPTCDQPNRLNRECDPGSRFRVLVGNDSAYIVAHCRKKNNKAGEYGDIAVIQHNNLNGATCFYQAGPDPGISHSVAAPSKGLGKWSPLASETSKWHDPGFTRNQGCGGCHDNGPLIRSPYLNQVAGPNAIPGKDDRTFNREPQPYCFVGKDFTSWNAFKVEIRGNTCNGCHRMGVNNVSFGGTARDFGLRATADCSAESPATCESEKNFHSPASPIWMTPGQITFRDPLTRAELPQALANKAAAEAISECATRLHADPRPDSDECRITQFAGACMPGAVVVVNGATQSPPTPGRSEGGGDLSTCSPGGSCPLGFCYFGTLHGPFWQTSPSTIPTGDPAYRGTFERIFAEGGKWKYSWLSDLGGPRSAPPGGTLLCTNYKDIVTVPDPTDCFANPFAVFDPDGTHFSQKVDATVMGSTANVLSGLVGNVAQSNLEDRLQVSESGGKVALEQFHSAQPPMPNQLGPKLGPLKGESYTNGCIAWTPVYEAKDIFTTSEVQLVSPAQSDNARCFITGVAGAWSSTRNQGTKQPFAEIYKGPANDIRLRVFPDNENDRVGAFASCIRVK